MEWTDGGGGQEEGVVLYSPFIKAVGINDPKYGTQPHEPT